MRSREPQYQQSFDDFVARGGYALGPMMSDTWRSDPRRLTFVLARYKFVSKVLAGKASVLEVGSGDGFGMALVLQSVGRAHGIDFDPAFVEYGNRVAAAEGLKASFSVHDMTAGPPPETYDAAYSLDVIEHIQPADEHRFLANIAAALTPAGVCIVGTPNLTSAPYASLASQEGHINLKTAETLRASLEPVFQNVFIFSMNDEVVHTGFYPMAHYLMALCVDPRPKNIA
jgi:2-polyprenyl-3-methyl-5-hydroxy-6-metoxy-1,4-benzoquinol methylase